MFPWTSSQPNKIRDIQPITCKLAGQTINLGLKPQQQMMNCFRFSQFPHLVVDKHATQVEMMSDLFHKLKHALIKECDSETQMFS